MSGSQARVEEVRQRLNQCGLVGTKVTRRPTLKYVAPRGASRRPVADMARKLNDADQTSSSQSNDTAGHASGDSTPPTTGEVYSVFSIHTRTIRDKFLQKIGALEPRRANSKERTTNGEVPTCDAQNTTKSEPRSHTPSPPLKDHKASETKKEVTSYSPDKPSPTQPSPAENYKCTPSIKQIASDSCQSSQSPVILRKAQLFNKENPRSEFRNNPFKNILKSNPNKSSTPATTNCKPDVPAKPEESKCTPNHKSNLTKDSDNKLGKAPTEPNKLTPNSSSNLPDNSKPCENKTKKKINACASPRVNIQELKNSTTPKNSPTVARKQEKEAPKTLKQFIKSLRPKKSPSPMRKGTNGVIEKSGILQNGTLLEEEKPSPKHPHKKENNKLHDSKQTHLNNFKNIDNTKENAVIDTLKIDFDQHTEDGSQQCAVSLTLTPSDSPSTSITLSLPYSPSTSPAIRASGSSSTSPPTSPTATTSFTIPTIEWEATVENDDENFMDTTTTLTLDADIPKETADTLNEEAESSKETPGVSKDVEPMDTTGVCFYKAKCLLQEPGKMGSKEKVKVDESEPGFYEEAPFERRDVTVKNDRWVTDLYSVDSLLGKGKFGEVKKCQERATGRQLAAKFIEVHGPQDRSDVLNEQEIMKNLQHPRLLQLYDAFEVRDKFCLVMELVNGGELFERVINEDFILTEKACVMFTRQICDGVAFMHTQNILHLDMKPENILCLTREGNRIKIIDFGLARKYNPKGDLRVLFGTPEFVAPEVVNFDPISPSTDMWSIGVICYVLLSGLSPFMGESEPETLSNVTLAQWDFSAEEFDNISSEAKDFISKLLVKDPRKRMKSDECLEHQWLRRSVKREGNLPERSLSKKRLRKYVYRRKWQKAINAMLALRRMGVTLS